jgi:diguanylate cyclase (GGDEF)-like protein
MPLCLSFPIIGWAGWGTLDAQGAAMSAAEVIALALIIAHLYRLDARPDRVPARLMMLGCTVLGALYARDLWLALGGAYASNAGWVNIDLSTWYLLNFCMLMLTSFRAAEPLRQGALFDPLTGALNRRGLDAELAALQAGGQGVAVLAIDLDHFKAVNDAHGHAAGDLVLQRFADVVRGSIRSEDVFARVGGEEFMLVLRGLSPDDVMGTAERIRQRVAALVVDVDDARVQVTCSLGVAHARDGARMPTLRLLADEALYAAKRDGRDRIHVHSLD